MPEKLIASLNLKAKNKQPNLKDHWDLNQKVKEASQVQDPNQKTQKRQNQKIQKRQNQRQRMIKSQ